MALERLFRVVIDADGIFGELFTPHKSNSTFKIEAIHLELDAIAVGIEVIERKSHPVMDGPIGSDALLTQADVNPQQVADARVGVREMVDAAFGYSRAVDRPRAKDCEIDEAEPVILVVISQECYDWVAMDRGCLEQTLILRHHLIKPARHEQDVRELDRLGHGPLLQGNMKSLPLGPGYLKESGLDDFEGECPLRVADSTDRHQLGPA